MERTDATGRGGHRQTLAGAILRDARRRAGLTQVELSERAGVVRPLISQYENGKKDPSVTMVARLVEACGMESRIRAEALTDIERNQRAHDASSLSSGQAKRNADRARREVVSVRRPTAAEASRVCGAAVVRPRRDGDSDLRPVPIVEALERHEVRYVAIGSYAAIAEGVDLDVTDFDIVPAVDEENRARLVEALKELRAEERVGEGTEPLYDLAGDPD